MLQSLYGTSWGLILILMKFDWSGYFDLANELAAISDSESAKIVEAKMRSSISRAYYAAFCLARNYLRDDLDDRKLSNSQQKNTNVHWYVIQQFQTLGSRNKKMRQVGWDLENLREKRNMVDYDDVFSTSINHLKKLENEAKYCLKLAGNIITNLNELIGDTEV